MAVNKTGDNQPAGQVSYLDARVFWLNFFKGTKGFDDAILDDQHAVRIEARCFVLASNVFPRIIDKIKKGAANCVNGFIQNLAFDCICRFVKKGWSGGVVREKPEGGNFNEVESDQQTGALGCRPL